MSEKTLSGIVTRFETATADLKEVHTKLHAFQQAMKDLQEFQQKFNDAVARKDLVWLLKTQEHLNDIVRRLQELALDVGKVLV